MRPALLLLAFAAPAFAQNADIQKALIQRQQQSDAFALQLLQTQEAARLPPGDFRARQALEARQFSERRRLDNVSARQLMEVKTDLPQELRPYERQKAADERRPLTAPTPEFPVRPSQQPAQLQPSPRGIVQVIEAPR